MFASSANRYDPYGQHRYTPATTHAYGQWDIGGHSHTHGHNQQQQQQQQQVVSIGQYPGQVFAGTPVVSQVGGASVPLAVAVAASSAPFPGAGDQGTVSSSAPTTTAAAVATTAMASDGVTAATTAAAVPGSAALVGVPLSVAAMPLMPVAASDVNEEADEDSDLDEEELVKTMVVCMSVVV